MTTYFGIFLISYLVWISGYFFGSRITAKQIGRALGARRLAYEYLLFPSYPVLRFDFQGPEKTSSCIIPLYQPASDSLERLLTTRMQSEQVTSKT